ncbi:Rha family transcriptional regulator [Citrobacter freundii]|uniref:Rha family transcriptional regulator n=1 Tax=Citrobacter freundii TaxID=546 RepID=UPI001275B883|nr:Rha family transcriptional regulator [Citrobacter freundii]EAZ2691814.1 Rha family transcriptional regulator [Salmonella enterica]EBW5506559.1 transcriptional regulator [Salmonella enterica subsp. enterica serovar Kentucky]EBZ9032421.1 transcriptional regulator [Salmonella enterica subsp. enterica serovar Kentucky]ECD2000964.1 transcriptional regulator [Salmonella enterica subsp. enterica serovar Kentucky]EKR7384818.1 Rha family transcriptional regulator [Salmonella enterica]
MTKQTVANGRSVVTKMSSREIAKLTGKQHKHVLEDCRKMFESLKLQSAEFSADYQDDKGRTYQEYWLDQDLTMTLMMGYSIPLRHKVATRWRQLESGEVLPQKSASHLPEYRRARAIKMEVEAMSLALSFMPKLSEVAKQTAMVRAVNDAAGIELLPLPKLEEHYHSASEVGELLGVSAQKIGRVANANKLKSEEYGIFVMDKSAHSSKQVEAFRYNAEGVKALRHLIHGVDVA